MAEQSEKGTRARAPTITVDTSAVSDQPRDDADVTSAQPTSANPNKNTLAVPGRLRGDSVDSHSSQSSTGSLTVVGSPRLSHPGSEESHAFEPGSEEEVWKPEDEKEAALFNDENSPFGVTRGHLTKFVPRKELRAFYHVNGLHGLEKGLRTDLKNGLSTNEQSLNGQISFKDVKDVAPPEADAEPKRTLMSSNTESEEVQQLDQSAFSDRKRIFGDNRLPKKPAKPFWKYAWEALQDKILILLCVAAVVSLALGIYESISKKEGEGARIDWVEGVAILVAILLVVLVTATVDWRKERQFKLLKDEAADRTVKVIRSGKTVVVSFYDIFPGDVLLLEQGDIVPADGIFIEGHNVACDESSATGESDVMKKTPGTAVYVALQQGQDTKKLDPFILSGAKVAEGFGTYLATAVGVNSGYGKLMMSLDDGTEPTPLQYKLNRLASYIAKLGGSAGLLLFVVTFIEFLVRLKHPNADGRQKTVNEKISGFIKVLITAVTIIVVAVPEGLPLAVTLALAFATRRMGKENNLVRRLKSCETMGNATVICSDKTGTLTQNVMTVVAATFGRGSVRAGDKDKLNVHHAPEYSDGTSGSPDTKVSEATANSVIEMPIYDLHERVFQDLQVLLKESIAINSTAFESEEDGKRIFTGSKTETALLDFAARCFSMANLQKEREACDVVQLIPFDSKRKCMGVVIRKSDNQYRLLIKGASEIVLGNCSKVVKDPLESLEIADMSEEDKSTLGSTISSYASMSLRTIGIAYQDFSQWPPENIRTDPDNPSQVLFEDLFQNLTWISVVGIQDPVRAGVPEAVDTCEKAGVRVLMVTGDNVETARAIAKETGILKEKGIVLEGPKLRALSQVELNETLPRLCVVARSSPEDKKILVNAFRSNGEIVAVTGDGTNDAPALKAADVGFSMGITGTEIAKEASDIILLDDNFTSIVKALGWGRAINDAVKKFLQFQITVNIVAVILTFITAVASEDETPVLNAVQLLWVNLIMDTFAALALATDRPSGSLLARRPERRNASLISVTMWKNIIGQTIFQLIITLIMYFAGKNFIPYDNLKDASGRELKDPAGHAIKNEVQFATLVFNTFVWLQIFDCVNCRRIDNKLNIFEGFYKNRWFVLIITIMAGGQALIVNIGGAAFVVTRITGIHWAISIIIGLITLPVGAVLRLIPDRFIRIDIPIRKLYNTVVPEKVRARLRRRKQTPGLPETQNEDFTKEWARVYHKVQDDLGLYKKIRGRRLKYIKMGVKNPKQIFQKSSRTGSRHSVLPAIVASGAMAGGVGGGVTPSDQRSMSSRSIQRENTDPISPSASPIPEKRQNTDELV